MFALAIFIGIYSYLIFILGLLGLLYKSYVVVLTVIYVTLVIFFKVTPWLKVRPWTKVTPFLTFLRNSKLSILLFLLVFLQAVINLVGVLGPEYGFDALWYHLTLPKIYLLNHKIEYIPGGLLYYSTMPQFTEMLYVAALAFNGEILAKFIHFLFGLLSLAVLYKLSRKFLSTTSSLLVVVISYSNLAVSWESITAYIDLSRTFFEVLAMLAFINWLDSKQKKYFYISGLLLGFAISTKLIALGSLFIFTALMIVFYLRRDMEYIKDIRGLIINITIFCLISLLIVSPWFIYSFIYTGNPVYPFFTNTYPTKFDISLLNPVRFLVDIWNIFTHAADPISPIYIIVFPLTIIVYRKLENKFKPILFYSILSIITWYFTPQTGGGRFLVAYLPILSLISVIILNLVSKEYKILKNMLIIAAISISLVSIIYRGVANSRYIPVIMGKETKDQFLSKHLNFSFGDFYDIDGYFKKHIKPSDKVLLLGFHNLYYVDFPFVDGSWLRKEDNFNYIAVKDGDLPSKYENWRLIYQNLQTKVKLYSQATK